FKAKLTEQKGFLPKMSFIGHLAVPGLTDETFRSEYLAPNIKLAFLHSVSSLYSLGYNAGLAWNGVSPHPTFTYSIANGFSITKRLGLYVEAYGEALQRDFDNITVRADGGLTYIIGQDFMVDVSGGVGVTNNAPERFVSVGFSYRFKL